MELIRSRVSSPNGLPPGPSASDWARWTCRHFTRVGMPPADTPAISGTDSISSHGGPGSARAPPVARGQVGIVGEPGVHLPHQPGRLQRAHGTGGPRAGEVVQGRERRAVGQAGRRSRPRPAGRTGTGGPPPGHPAAVGRAARRPRRGRRLERRRSSCGVTASRNGRVVRGLHARPQLLIPGPLGAVGPDSPVAGRVDADHVDQLPGPDSAAGCGPGRSRTPRRPIGLIWSASCWMRSRCVRWACSSWSISACWAR